MVCSGAKGGKEENTENFRSGSAIRECIVGEMGNGDVAVE